MGGAFGTHGENEKCSTALLGQTKEDGTEGPDIDGSIILSVLKNLIRGVDSCVSE